MVFLKLKTKHNMKKISNFILTLPLIGLLSIYLYVLLTIICIDSTNFYKFDPKSTPVGFLYKILIIFPAFGYLGILLGFIILFIDYYKYKGNLTSMIFKWIYFIGLVLTFFLHYVDLGYCQIWFFD